MVFQSVGYNNDFSRQIDSQIKSSSAKRDHLECAACPSCAVEWWRVPLSPKVVGLSAGGKGGGGCRGFAVGRVRPTTGHVLFPSLMSYRPRPLYLR